MAVQCLSPAAPHGKKVFALMPNHSVRTLLIACCVTALLTAAVVAGADEPSPQAKPTLANRLPAFHDLVRVDAAPLAALPIQGDSLSLFKTVVGPQLGLNDVAMTLGSPISPSRPRNSCGDLPHGNSHKPPKIPVPPPEQNNGRAFSDRSNPR